MKKASSYDKECLLGYFMSLDEERLYYEEVLQRVINNPRFYLDNLDDLEVFYCSFINYFPADKYNPNQYHSFEVLEKR